MEEVEFESIYATLPPDFYSRHPPEPLTNQYQIHFNEDAARLIELDPQQSQRSDFVDLMTGVIPLPGTDHIAMCYAGHQFGHYVARLGDGRAVLVGQVKTSENRRWDMQVKGSGRTLYSRQGDGKAVLRSTIREYLCSAAMHGLGIPTTHALALIGSDEPVHREQLETGAMLVRLAPSHIRFGSFEYFFYQNRYDDLEKLGRFTIDHYFPHLKQDENPILALLSEVVQSTARLIARWQSVGFCHGVMNSDNMSIHGITIDYGPFGFLDEYRSSHICNHSDHGGRYAFDQQPRIGLFNLSCFAQAVLPLLHDDPEEAVKMATAELQKYEAHFDSEYLDLKRTKLGFLKKLNQDEKIYDDFLVIMEENEVDFTNSFRLLSEPGNKRERLRDSFTDKIAFDNWYRAYLVRLEDDQTCDQDRSMYMKTKNPKYILRNYMAEIAIKAARDDQDFTIIDQLMNVLKSPFDEQPEYEHFAGQPPEWSATLSVSCSS
jgi:uncharacterized protein YdiU (UPF0061 family)